MVAVRKAIMIAAILCFFAALGLNTYMELSYADRMPGTPDPAASRTIAMSVNHNTRVYVTAEEYRSKKAAEHFFFWGGPICFALIGLLQVYYKVF